MRQPAGNRPLGRYRRRWQNNIKIDEKIGLEEEAWNGLVWLNMDKWRVV